MVPPAGLLRRVGACERAALDAVEYLGRRRAAVVAQGCAPSQAAGASGTVPQFRSSAVVGTVVGTTEASHLLHWVRAGCLAPSRALAMLQARGWEQAELDHLWQLLVPRREYALYLAAHHATHVAPRGVMPRTWLPSPSSPLPPPPPPPPLFHAADLDAWLELLPPWVLDELTAHAAVPRPPPGPYLPHQLSAGETHDRLFNGIARRLRRFGDVEPEFLVGYWGRALLDLAIEPLPALRFALREYLSHGLGSSVTSPDAVAWLLVGAFAALHPPFAEPQPSSAGGGLPSGRLPSGPSPQAIKASLGPAVFQAAIDHHHNAEEESSGGGGA